jgi:hypothetical protein
VECVRRIRELCDKLQIVEGQDSLSREAQRNATLLFHTLLRSTLASKRVCGEYKLTRAAWHWLTGEVETRCGDVLGVVSRYPGILVQMGVLRAAMDLCGWQQNWRQDAPVHPPLLACLANSACLSINCVSAGS